MRPNDIEPVVTQALEKNKHVEDYTERHPAYGQIGASRVTASPGTYLYGSDFRHNSYIMIRIGSSEMKRNISHDWHYSPDTFVEVAVSEAQWATFVSTLNMGQGTCCTIVTKDGRYVPGITRPKSKTAQFSEEATATLQETRAALETLKAQLEASGLSEKKKREMMQTVHQAENNLAPNLAYVAKCFTEHVEATTEKAKIEVSAYVSGVIHRTGIEALRGQVPFELSDGKKEDK